VCAKKRGAAMSVEQQKQEAEQNTLVENSSSVNVKTPLVDALRSYFWKESYNKYGTKTILTNMPEAV
jgi:hypothetical protein